MYSFLFLAFNVFFLCILFMVLKMKLSVLVEQAMIEKEVFETLVNFVQPEQGRSLAHF